MSDTAEDRLAELESVWFEIIEAVSAGRTQGLVCPECHHPDELQLSEQGGRVEVSCPNCQRVVEVQIGTA
jgi:hypothetical protein